MANDSDPKTKALRPRIEFAEFTLDLESQQLLREGKPLSLRPRTWAVLCYIAERPGRLITKNELLDNLWPGISVSEATLSTSISEIRKVLGDPARNPKFLATVHGRGFRFIGEIDSNNESRWANQLPSPDDDFFVGREDELLVIHDWMQAARDGQRIVGFLSGEAGIGKTFVGQRAVALAQPNFLVGVGQCVERVSYGEAFGPILEAVGYLASGQSGDLVLHALEKHAPSWLLQIPALANSLSEEHSDRLHRQSRGESPARATRQLAEALEFIARERPLMLWLEDLHWADEGTWNVLETLARRPTEAQLFILASHRPADGSPSGNRLRQRKPEMISGRGGRDLRLSALDEADISTYLERRCPGVPREIAEELHRHTGGNSLFVSLMLDFLIETNEFRLEDGRWGARLGFDSRELAVPQQLDELLRQQDASLDPTLRAVLEAASVAGDVFESSSVAAALSTDIETVEEYCESLVLQLRLVRRKRRPSTLSSIPCGRYGFTHILRRNASYQQIPESMLVRYHRAIADDLAARYSRVRGAMSTEIAEHYVAGDEPFGAAHYLCRAAEAALALGAWSQANQMINRATEQLAGQPPGKRAEESEIDVKRTRAALNFMQYGMGDDRSYTAYDEILNLGDRLNSHVLRSQGLDGVGGYHLGRANYVAVAEYAQRLIRLGEEYDEPLYRMLGETKLACSSFYQADFPGSAAADQEARRLYAQSGSGRGASQVGTDPATVSGSHAAVALQAIGQCRKAEITSRDVLAHARRLGDPFNECFALMYASYYYWFLGNWDTGLALAEECQESATENGYGMQWEISRRFLKLGHAELGRPELISSISPGDPDADVAGSQAGAPGLLWCVAREHLLRGKADQADATAVAALDLSALTRAPFQDAEIFCTRAGASLALGCDLDEVESFYQAALKTSTDQGTSWVELRILIDLALRLGLSDLRLARLRQVSEQFERVDSALARQAVAICSNPELRLETP